MKEVEHLANKERDSIELVETNIENWTYIHQVDPNTIPIAQKCCSISAGCESSC